jgi:hypothetical protein
MVTIASVVIIAGCSADPTATPEPSSATELSFHESVLQARAEAEEQGADEAQLAILDEALTSDEIRFEDAQQALTAYGECLEGAGLALEGVQVIDDGGFKRFDYSVSLGTDDAMLAVADACYLKTFNWVDMLYQTQPAATEADDAEFSAALPELIVCLKAGGVPVDDDSPADEVKQAMSSFMRERMPQADDPDAEVDPAYQVVPDCLLSVGLNGF